MSIEHRFSPIAYRGGHIEGTAIRYGDTARISGPGGYFLETVLPGAFGDITGADAILNIMHNREKPIARTGGGPHDGLLTLHDDAERLRLKAALPDTTDGRDAKALLEARILRGLSLEMVVSEDEIDQAARLRIITRAKLRGVALVDRPAYEQSEAVLKRFELVEDRAAAFAGHFDYSTDVTLSDRGRVRKQRVNPGAFSYSIQDDEREITLQIGNDPEKLLGSKRAGTLELKDTAKALAFTLPAGLPDTSYSRDLQAQIRAGLIIGVQPMFRKPPPDVKTPTEVSEIIPEPGNPDVEIEVIKDVVLYALAVRMRPPDKGEASGVEETRQEARRALTWL